MASAPIALANTENVTGTDQVDILTGNGLANILNGGGGNDTIDGGIGNDTINGGTGDDIITYFVGSGADSVNGGADSDRLTILGTTGNEQLDVIVNGAGVVTSIGGGSVTSVETITVNLGLGVDTISYAGSASSYRRR